jgi:hypothetical protein
MIARLSGRATALVGLLVLSSTGLASVSASTPADSSATSFDCSTEARAYPERWQAEGATFLGKVLSSRTLAPEFRVVRFAVQRHYAGDIGETVTVRTACVETRFRIGERYLVSSRGYRPATGRIDTVGFGSAASVAWHVADDGSIKLLGYGAGLGGPPAPYLTRPDTVVEAAHAVAFGTQKEGWCTGGTDHKKVRWHMEVDKVHAMLQVVVFLDGHRERTWTVDLYHDYARFFHRTGLLAQTDLEIARERPDTDGPDRMGFRATQSDGEVCRGVITY